MLRLRGGALSDVRELCMAKNLTARSEDYSRWYNDLVLQAELADYAPVKAISVAIRLGETALKRMPARAWRTAISRVMATSAPLLAV